MPSPKATVSKAPTPFVVEPPLLRGRIRFGTLSARTVTGDTAIALLKAGAETDKRDTDGYLALDLAPSKEVRNPPFSGLLSNFA